MSLESILITHISILKLNEGENSEAFTERENTLDRRERSKKKI